MALGSIPQRTINAEQQNPQRTPPTPTPTTTQVPAPQETHSIPWGVIAAVAVCILVSIVIAILITYLVARITAAKASRDDIRQRITAQYEELTAKLKRTMAEFTNVTTDPITTLKYPLFLASEHPSNKAFVNAMMQAYREQETVDAAIESNLKRNPERIDLDRFESLVKETTSAFDTLNYNAKRIGTPLLPLDMESTATKLLQRALDESNFPNERTLAMNKLIAMLNDARDILSNTEEQMLLDNMLDTLQRAKNAGNVLVAPDNVTTLNSVINSGSDHAALTPNTLPEITA